MPAGSPPGVASPGPGLERGCQSLGVRDGLIAENIKLGDFDVGVRQVAKVLGSGRSGIETDTLFLRGVRVGLPSPVALSS